MQPQTRTSARWDSTGPSPGVWLRAMIALWLVLWATFALAVPPLTVQGNTVLVGGQKKSLGGMSLFWSNNGWGGEKFYNAGAVSTVHKDWKASIIRAAMGVDEPGGYLSDRSGNRAKVERVVEAAIANDMYVIIDWHSHHAENHTADAVAFFRDMAAKYGQYPNVIYEIYNEPLQVSWSGTIKPYAEAVIRAIREVDPDNLIVVGTPTWSQDVDAASRDPIQGTNIAYTLHFYAGTHGEWLRNKAREAMNNGIALFVTEWGTVNANGDGGVNHGETDAWISFMKEHGIHHANWALNDKAEGASALPPGASPNGGWQQLTASGQKVREILRSADSIPGGTTPPGPTPSGCSQAQPTILPARVEAENYCAAQGIKTERTTDTGGGQNVGWTDAGDSLDYRLEVPEAGEWKLTLRVASLSDGGVLQLSLPDSGLVMDEKSLPVTGGWQAWQSVNQTVTLPAGTHTLRVSVLQGGWNLNWIRFEKAGDSTPPGPVTPPPTTGGVAPLSVQGNRILMGGQPARLAGASFFWSNTGWGGEAYYNKDVVTWLRQDWQARLVRAAMGVDEGGGYLEQPGANMERVRNVVEAAIANDMYVIIDWHSHHAEQHTDAAIQFFQQMASDYGEYPNVIYEIYNEPLDTASWSGTIKPYAERVIGAIRAIDPDNLIVVGTRTWSQRVDEAANDPIAGTNIAYGLHFYIGAHGQSLRDLAQQALNKGIALFVTEWGIWPASWGFLPERPSDQYIDQLTPAEQAEVDAWKQFMVDHHIPSAAWSVSHKREPSSYLYEGASTQGSWSDSQLTGSGKAVRALIREINGGQPPGNGCTAQTVPGRVQAENFCAMNGIRTETTTDQGGGQNIGWVDTGDWLTYRLNIAQKGCYRLSFRVASNLNEQGGFSVSGLSGVAPFDIHVPFTGGWQNWQTVEQKVVLETGEQTLKLTAKRAGWNLNYIDVQPAANACGNTTPPGQHFSVTIQGEDYEWMSGVRTQSTRDTGGGENVGWIDAGDWMSFREVTVPESGTYTVEYRVASRNGGGHFQLEEAGGWPVYDSVDVPHTGDWQNWTTVRHQVHLKAGKHRFGIGVQQGGWNLNWFRISR